MKLIKMRSLQHYHTSRVANIHGDVVGEVRVIRASGWRGGNTYEFEPNELGLGLGLRSARSQRLRELFSRAVSLS